MLTAGESHGKALVAVLEGLPAGVPVDPGGARAPARAPPARARPGRPAALRIGSVRDPRRRPARLHAGLADRGHDPEPGVRGEVRRADGRDGRRRIPPHASPGPGPGHADLAGAQKYGFDDVRNVLERASARETAARVTAGTFCRWFLAELGVEILSHVVRIGSVKAPARRRPPVPGDGPAIDRDRRSAAPTPTASRAMVAEIDRLRKERDTVGGVFEVLAYGVPPGLGSYVHYDRKLDGRLAARAHEHPVGEGGRGRRRVRDRGEARVEGARRDRAARRSHRAADGPGRRHRGRHEHRRADQAPRRHEAVLDRAEAAGHGRPRAPGSRRSRSSSAPTSARCPRAASSARPSWPSSSRTPCWRSSGAIRCPRPARTWSGTWRGCRDRVPGGHARRRQDRGRPGARGPARGAVHRPRHRDRARGRASGHRDLRRRGRGRVPGAGGGRAREGEHRGPGGGLLRGRRRARARQPHHPAQHGHRGLPRRPDRARCASGCARPTIGR